VGRAVSAHCCAHRRQATVESGLRRPNGDVEDRGQLREGQAEVEVQDEDGALVDEWEVSARDRSIGF